MTTYINPKYTRVTIEDDEKEHRWIDLSTDPDDCMFRNFVHIPGDSPTAFRFPFDCNREAELLITSGAKLNVVSDGDKLPYDEIVVSYGHLNRQYIVGRAACGQLYAHMKLPHGIGLIAAV